MFLGISGSYPDPEWDDLSKDAKSKLKELGYSKENYKYFDVIYKHGNKIIGESILQKICDGIDTSSFQKYEQLIQPILINKYYPYTSYYEEKQHDNVKSIKVDQPNLGIGKVFQTRYPDRLYYQTKENSPFNLFYEGGYEDKEYYLAFQFFADMIRKYELSNMQMLVLLINFDLLHNLYIEHHFKAIYGDNLNFISNNTDKIINNLKLLIYDDIEKELTCNSLGNLKDNFIFYVDVEKIIKNFPSITTSDIIHIVTGKNVTNVNELYQYIDLLSTLDEKTKQNLITATCNIFTSTSIFPNLEVENSNQQGIDLVEYNPIFFNEYSHLFEDELNLDYLLSIKDNPNFDEVMKTLASFKRALSTNITKYTCDLKREPVYEYKDDLEHSGPNCYHEWVHTTKEVLTGHNVVGVQEYGKSQIEEQKKLFQHIKKEGLNPDFQFMNLFNYYLESEIENNSIQGLLFSMLKEYKKITNNKENNKVFRK